MVIGLRMVEVKISLNAFINECCELANSKFFLPVLLSLINQECGTISLVTDIAPRRILRISIAFRVVQYSLIAVNSKCMLLSTEVDSIKDLKSRNNSSVCFDEARDLCLKSNTLFLFDSADYKARKRDYINDKKSFSVGISETLFN